jgi:diguanylate cyclase (GGDEF)-like protein/PAS domain S-box-containing protein
MTFTSVNPAACAWLGYTREELLGVRLHEICPPGDVAALAQRLDRPAAEEPATALIRTVQRRKDGTTTPAQWHVSRVWVGGSEYWIVVARDLSGTEAFGGVVAAARELGLLGHDPLTGLPDRRLFDRRLDRALGRAHQRENYVFAVCFMDLDGFKAVNDRLGHLAGDRVLCEVARRLAGCTRPGDMAARYGGDEFTVFVDDLHDAEDALLVAKRILRQVGTPVAIGGCSVQVSASIGVAMSSAGCRRGEELLANADRAMYRAKSLGGGKATLFEAKPSPRPIKPR